MYNKSNEQRHLYFFRIILTIILFICVLFCATRSVPNCEASNGRSIGECRLDLLWKEAVEL